LIEIREVIYNKMSRQNCRGDAVRAAHFLSKRMYPEVPAVDR
jgi:hypothetical protein